MGTGAGIFEAKGEKYGKVFIRSGHGHGGRGLCGPGGRRHDERGRPAADEAQGEKGRPDGGGRGGQHRPDGMRSGRRPRKSSPDLVANSNGEASKLSTARKIGNVSFDGSADIALKDVLFSGYASSGTLKYSADNYDYLIIDATFTDTNNNSYDTCFMIVNSVSSWYDGCNWSYVDDNGTIWNSNFSFNVNGTSFSITANTERYDMNTGQLSYTDCSVKISAIHGFKF